MSEPIGYRVYLPQETDDFITNVVLAYNKKVKPDQYITNEVYVNWVVRDWYIQVAMQKFQRDASNKELERQMKMWQETFKVKK